MLKKIVRILFLLVLAYAVARFFVVFQDSRLTGERAPYLQSSTSNSVVIHWLTEDAIIGVIRYGEDRKNFMTLAMDKRDTTNHIIQLSNLKPATSYYYQVGDITGFKEFDANKHWFKTHPEEIVETRVWVIGDSGEIGDSLAKVRDAALNWMRNNPISEPAAKDSAEKQEPQDQNLTDADPIIDIWLALGDIAYRSGTNAQYQAALFDPFEDILSNTALFPVYGNHDDRRWTYFRIFDLPEHAEAGGLASETENYYAIDYSNIHFVILDSQASDRSPDGEMADWLKADLAQNTKPWVVAALHHPPYSKGSHDSDDDSDSGGRMLEMRENIVPILEAAGVDLVLSGHSHMYERSYMIDCAYGESDSFSKNNITHSGVNNKHQEFLKSADKKPHQGTVYVVAGSSSKVDQGPLDHPVHAVGLQEPGSVVIDVIDNKLTSYFINEKGQVKDKFSIEKNAQYQSSYKGCL